MTAFIVYWLMMSTLSFGSDGEYKIYKSDCRRNALFKVTDRDKKVNDGLEKTLYVEYLVECLKDCLENHNCLSFNYKASKGNSQCELLSSTLIKGGTLVEAAGWNHYEPAPQKITPGCQVAGQSSACPRGYICKDACKQNQRFRCTDINECASNPCYNGGNCNNQVNHYSCSCVNGYTGSRCQTAPSSGGKFWG